MSEKAEVNSKKAERRQTKQATTVKQAFVEDDAVVNEEKRKDEDVEEKIKATREKSKKRSKGSKKNSSSSDKKDSLKKELERKQARAIFTFNNISVEIVLKDDFLTWRTVSGEVDQSNNAIKKESTQNSDDSIRLKDVFAITPVYQDRWPWTLSTVTAEKSGASSTASTPSSSPPLGGFQMHSYQRSNDSILQEIIVNFRSDLPEQIEHWFQLLTRILESQRPRREIIVLCHTYAGARDSRWIYTSKLKNLLDRAKFDVNYAEIHDLCPVDEVLRGFKDKFLNLYGLVILGGDGSVIQTINALIQIEAIETRSKLDRQNEFPNLTFPICIVGTGTTNIICHSIYGTNDPVTSILHLLCNKQMKIDMSAVFDIDDQFLTANFGAAAGFPANALKYFSRYSTQNSKKVIQKSFSRASATKNLKPIPMKIRYIPDYRTTPLLSACRENCTLCNPNVIDERNDEVLAFDTTHIPKSNTRIKSSSSDHELNTRSGIFSAKKSRNSPQNDSTLTWKTLENSYLEAAVLTNANLWSFAPQGFSKYAHLADGVLNLILIESTSRKEFLRYVKRNGNSKDPFEFSFTKLIKAKEVEIELDLPVDDPIYPRETMENDFDSSLSEDSSNEEHENYRRKSSFSSEVDGRPPRGATADLIRRDQQQLNDENDDASRRRRKFFPLPKSKKESSTNSRPSTSIGDRKRRPSVSGTTKTSESSLNLASNDSNLRERRSSVISRSLSVDQNISNNSTSKKSSKKKKTPCMWNLNFTPYNHPVIRIKCFHRYLPVFGAGPNPNGLVKEVQYSCF